jgi:hypothetical protein
MGFSVSGIDLLRPEGLLAVHDDLRIQDRRMARALAAPALRRRSCGTKAKRPALGDILEDHRGLGHGVVVEGDAVVEAAFDRIDLRPAAIGILRHQQVVRWPLMMLAR